MFFERAEGGEQAVLVHVDFFSQQDREDVDEFIDLATSAGVTIRHLLRGSRNAPNPKSFIGSGKLEELQAVVQAEEANVVLFNHTLSPSQQRNLEAQLECRVIDRTGLILDIFAQRARTHEGQLQVELAQLQYVSTRLVRGWTHLERQKGGIGLRGPGETQLETDRRLIRDRIKSIQRRLDKVKKQRDQGRRSRNRAEVPTVAIVGYTNAGKSTLFNHITDADVYAADQLFATLDPTLRRIELPGIGPVVLADTVGFIRHLPHRLVDAFKATLEETVEADLLVHVVDSAAEERLDNIDQVNEVLREIGADEKPQLMVYNKIDLLGNVEPKIDTDADGVAQRVWVSARQGSGIGQLLDALASRLATGVWRGQVSLPPNFGQLRAQLFALHAIETESWDDQGNQLLDVCISAADIRRLEKQMVFDWQALVV
ncbi:GTPase HflX [BD1-7 clade bacterium]|uniref:GTPase HflX n=1 Tax=BD1-7 clade bacterium TaxID=2029982 RepID=A0A5S9N124_9GAMM|nr:GTPase HflX [BD1-7 clade bacterium]CAA0082537.1 GTPase HflX [BD1-7 clade bacterium]